MEGYLPLEWCIIWYLVMIPFVVLGFRKIVRIVRSHPEQRMLVALSGAFIFLLSSLKLPSVTGSSSHPTGTGLAVVLYGVFVCSSLSMIVLIFQALLLAHGGITTLGANCVSMGIIGPAAGLLAWRLLRGLRVRVVPSMFAAAFFADLTTYVVTAVQLTICYHSNGWGAAFTDFMTTYAVTQIPLSFVEGMLFAMFAKYLLITRPDIFGQDKPDKPINWKAYAAGFAIIAVAVVGILAYGDSQGMDFGGSDDAGSGDIADNNGGSYEPWTSGIWGDYELPGETESMLFALQAAIGALIIGYFIGIQHAKRKLSDNAPPARPLPAAGDGEKKDEEDILEKIYEF
ncbi:energy-coupling factor ABC transporter permease [Methanomassiliicoccales archaeon LGM-DZ1]|nr:energy-coupling factor ABC transporter permease [Methanomassiliicoccales archaeon LGM-DZ1]